MSHDPPQPPTRRDGAEPGAGWFAYAPASAGRTSEHEDPEVGNVDLRPDEYAGPFWEVGGSLGDDFDELHRWIGISRALYDERAGRLVGDTGDTGDRSVVVLPPVPSGLALRVQAWVGERASYATATPDDDEAIFAWQDEGTALARELQQTLGLDYEVLAR